MKKDTLADLWEGVVPRSVKTFSELHDYVVANCYGGSEAFLDGLDAAVPDTDEGHTSAMNALCDLMNPAMDIILEWLASGRTRCRTADPLINAAFAVNSLLQSSPDALSRTGGLRSLLVNTDCYSRGRRPAARHRLAY